MLAPTSQKTIGIDIDIGSFKKNSSQYISYIKELTRSVNAFIQQLNPTLMNDTVRKAVGKALRKNKIRVRGNTYKLVQAFNATETSNNSGKTIQLRHDWFSKKDVKFLRGSRSFKLMGTALYSIVDTGRKAYKIVIKENKDVRSSPLKFFAHRRGNYVVYFWKGPRGGLKRQITVGQNAADTDFATGSRITEAAESAIEAMVIERQKKIEQRITDLMNSRLSQLVPSTSVRGR